MKTYRIALAALVTLQLVSCSKSGSMSSSPVPAASFTYSGAGMAPANVSFTNTSSNATSYLWDFGDNGTSTEASPSHTYTKGGVYTVSLKAQGSGGNSTSTKTINITAPTSVKIVAFKLDAFPLTKSNGGGWQSGSGPNIYAEVDNVVNNTVTALYKGGYYSSVSLSQLPLSWTLTSPVVVTDFTMTYQAVIYNYNALSTNDLMGGAAFKFSSIIAAGGYPSTVVLQDPSSTTKIELTLQWQ